MMKHPLKGIRMLQREQEFMSLVAIYRKLKPVNVVEVGSFQGGTLWYWLKYAAPGALVVSVDRASAERAASWQAWVQKGATLKTVCGDSTDRLIVERVEHLLPTGVDFLFIDGGHDYETAKADFEQYGRMLRAGGVIALHDIFASNEHPEYGVPRLWGELKPRHNTLELSSVPNQNGMGIGVVYV